MVLSKNGLQFELGQTILRAIVWSRSPLLDECVVTRIEDDKLYLNDSKVAIVYPERLWILK